MRSEGRSHLELVHPLDRGELALGTALLRRFLGIAADEVVELTFLVRGRPFVAYARPGSVVRLLKEGERLRGFNGAYQLVNGPIAAPVLCRYRQDCIQPAWNGRVRDAEIALRRAVFIDIDAVRLKGISSTEDEKAAAYDVCCRVEEFIASVIGDPCAIGRGDSGNGYFVLVAIEPAPATSDSAARVSHFLKLLGGAFNTNRVQIDATVANLARLMPCPGTWKRKGESTRERPHRRTSFSCRSDVSRVPLEAIVG